MAFDSITTDYKKESPTSEERLFLRIQELLEEKEIFTLSKLRREDIAELLGTNGTYVADAIRICSPGLSVSKYVNQKRVEYAQYLFENDSEKSIGEVADLCGFFSRSRFSTAFKTYYHMTPSEFRNAIKVRETN